MNEPFIKHTFLHNKIDYVSFLKVHMMIIYAYILNGIFWDGY